MQVYRSWLELIRLPAVFSAPADVLGALAFAHTLSIEVDGSTASILIVVALLLYMSGMIANDIFDLAVDTVERPARPLPSGRITVSAAWCVTLVMQCLGVGLAYALSTLTGHCAVVLCALTYLYNGVTKTQRLGPLVMGLCRGANVCLGLSVVPQLGVEHHSWLMVLAIVLYIWSVTLVSRYEVPVQGEEKLAYQAIVRLRLAGIVMLLYLPLAVMPRLVSVIILCSTLMWLNLDFGRLRFRPIEGPVRFEVIRGLQGIIVAYSAVCIAFGALGIAGSLLALLLIGKWTARWFYAT
jgi:4-hydroxybenzoate polyprenyltransferase